VGRYQVRVEATGFNAYVQEVNVSVDQETTVGLDEGFQTLAQYDQHRGER
jgi:PEGA domain